MTDKLSFQAYCKHAQTSLIDEIPEKIHEFINDFMKLSEMCIEHGILIEDVSILNAYTYLNILNLNESTCLLGTEGKLY